MDGLGRPPAWEDARVPPSRKKACIAGPDRVRSHDVLPRWGPVGGALILHSYGKIRVRRARSDHTHPPPGRGGPWTPLWGLAPPAFPPGVVCLERREFGATYRWHPRGLAGARTHRLGVPRGSRGLPWVPRCP